MKKIAVIISISILALATLPESMAQNFSCSSAVSFFEIEPTFGPEFTFTNPELVAAFDKNQETQTSENLSKYNEIRLYLYNRHSSKEEPKSFFHRLNPWEIRKKKKTQTKIVEGWDKHGPTTTVIFPDRSSFTVSIDNAVLEVQTSPSTLAEFMNRSEFLQREIFDMMKLHGLIPHEFRGGGHIHLGNSIFQSDPQLFKDFLADYANHPELTYGIFAKSLLNSPPMASLKIDQQKKFQEIIQSFDKLSSKERTITWIKEEISEKVYTWFPLADKPRKEFASPDYFQAIRFVRLNQTFEVRGFRPQRSFTDFLLQTEMIQLRLHYLKANPGVQYIPRETYDVNQPPQTQVDTFYRYITEMGGDWDRFKVLMPESLQKVNPSAKTLKQAG